MDSSIISIATLGFSIFCNAVLVFVWYVNSQRSSERKSYAAERQFKHLENNQKQISESIDHVFQELQEDFRVMGRDILEIKIQMGIDKKNSE
ncbi:hypothetical protein NIES4074_36270 [Cylindrospermum sp. NIES-4074]|nr:hypothetical protein NIES4074_36270 [Cylindrospermum sp. NIES-4074]